VKERGRGGGAVGGSVGGAVGRGKEKEKKFPIGRGREKIVGGGEKKKGGKEKLVDF